LQTVRANPNEYTEGKLENNNDETHNLRQSLLETHE
jgi:hypothetical protein